VTIYFLFNAMFVIYDYMLGYFVGRPMKQQIIYAAVNASIGFPIFLYSGFKAYALQMIQVYTLTQLKGKIRGKK